MQHSAHARARHAAAAQSQNCRQISTLSTAASLRGRSDVVMLDVRTPRSTPRDTSLASS